MFSRVLIIESCKILFYGALFLNECQCVTKLVNVSHRPDELFYLICTKRMHISNSEVIRASKFTYCKCPKFLQKLFLIFNFFSLSYIIRTQAHSFDSPEIE